MKPEKIFYFASTHWDREWYKTIDQFRFKLVTVMDKVIDTLQKDSSFKIFTIDGQTSLIEDYLIIRKENRDKLTQLIQDGRIIIGPWYTMPDEYLISSESIIQNLLAGHNIAESYHVGPLKCGYVCDIFGHIANLPQILNGFNIDNALVSRGTNDSEIECFFDWKSPDGSSVLTFKAPETCGYGSFFYETMSEFAPNYSEHLDEITEKAISYVERELKRTSLPYVILMDGMDHETIHEFAPELLRRLSEHFQCPVVQESLDSITQNIPVQRPSISGELNSHGKENVMHNKMIPHTLSSRYDLKKANDICQTLLEHYTMPCAAISEIYKQPYIYEYISYAYSHLLQNHAHDSICGCSIDAVHREMLTRFEKTYNTSKEYFDQFCTNIYEQSLSPDGTCTVKIFNPMPYEYHGLLEFDIDFAPDFPVTELPYIKYEQRNAFRVYDEDNNELKYNIVNASRQKFVKEFGHNKRLADTHRIAVISLLRPMGFTSFQIKPFDKPYRITERLSTGPNSCENDYIVFTINADGTVNIKDKHTGITYENLHSFLDCGEIGDGWYHIRPINDRVVSSIGCSVSIEKIFDGYAACRFLIRYEWLLPTQRENVLGFSCRINTYEPYIIESEFTISRTSKLVTVKTTIENTISDHRLQLHLPTNICSDSYYVNQCNLILSRTTGIDHSHYTWKEADISEYPFENLAFIKDSNHGLLFLSKGGLHEISCPGGTKNSMDITMLRCFSKTTGTNGETDGQLHKTQVIEYALMPLSSETNNEIVKIKDQYISGYYSFTIPAAKNIMHESAFHFNSENCSYITSMPSKQSGIIIRAANYSTDKDSCTVTFAKDIETACLCDFLENKISDITFSHNHLTASVPPLKMVNLHITFKE